MKYMNAVNKKKDLNYGFWMIAIIGLVVLLYCFSDGISGNDFWWHIKAGEWICENKQVPKTDIFSWYGMSLNIPWTAHEWLSEVVFYIIHKYSGDIGIYLFSLISALCMYFLLLHQTKEYVKNNLLISGLFFALFAVSTSLFFYGRPHIFTYFLLFFELKILYNFNEDSKTNKIFLIPLIACIWSNFHGGSACLSYGLCIVFLLTGLCKFKCGRVYSTRMEKRAIIKLTVTTILSVIAILVNPIGVKALTYPIVNQGDNLMVSVISEWQAPDAKDIGTLILCFVPIIIMTIGFFTEHKKISFIDIAIMGIFLFLFFRSIRFISLWYIAAAFYAFKYMPKCKVKEVKKKSEKIAVAICFIIMFIPVIMGGQNFYQKYIENDLIVRVLSDDMIKAIKKDAPKKLFNDYNYGEALIYNDIPVFFDARADLYAAENILADGVSLMFLEQANADSETSYVDVDFLLGKYGFDAILISKQRALYSYIMSKPENFDCIYSDDNSAYFKIIK